jgi:DNA-binding transcriptional ArsR family regulator
MSRPANNELLAQGGAYAPVFAALGDPTRLSLIATLCGGPPCSISKLTEDTKLTRQAVTKHLRVLQQARLVRNARAGRESRFAFNPEPIEALREYLDRVSRQWDDALERLRTFVED